uniref:Uncharacterized protein n=1 Tax=Arundo donax TaxID=35708 RepID=A0A0A9CIK0_ARUDO
MSPKSFAKNVRYYQNIFFYFIILIILARWHVPGQLLQKHVMLPSQIYDWIKFFKIHEVTICGLCQIHS